MNTTSIKTAVYQTLSPAERIRATISAIARDDDHEIEKLAETCPRKTYTQPDAAFLDALQKLQTLSLAVEGDLRANALDWLMSMRLEEYTASNAALVSAASIQAAWLELLGDHQLDPAEMSKASPERHFAVISLLELAEGEESEELKTPILEAFRDFLA